MAALAALLAAGCSAVPRELNLSPLWFHRMDAEGNLLEWDAAWPLVHYERPPDGGADLRIRPLYRRVTPPAVARPADAAAAPSVLPCAAPWRLPPRPPAPPRPGGTAPRTYR